MQVSVVIFEPRALGLLVWEKNGHVHELSWETGVLGSTAGVQQWLLVVCLLRR